MNPRNITAIRFSNGGTTQSTATRYLYPVWTRHYARIDSAMKRVMELFVIEGEPGDVVEFSHKVTGMQIGTMKMHVMGTVTATWAWDDDYKRDAGLAKLRAKLVDAPLNVGVSDGVTQ